MISKTWFSFVQTCTYFQRFNDQEELKRKFLIKVENIGIWKVTYILPNGQLHNYEAPSIISYGARQWWQYGELHRDDDLPAVIRSDGTQFWYLHGQLHRTR